LHVGLRFICDNQTYDYRHVTAILPAMAPWRCGDGVAPCRLKPINVNSLENNFTDGFFEPDFLIDFKHFCYTLSLWSTCHLDMR
jgi:hypothetical protein